MLDNIQFNQRIDASKNYKTLVEYVRKALTDFLTMLSMQEPKEFGGYRTKQAQRTALKKCAKLIDRSEKTPTPLQDPLAAWYQYALIEFVDEMFSEVSEHLLPEDVIKKGKQLDYIRDTVRDELLTHKGGTGSLKLLVL